MDEFARIREIQRRLGGHWGDVRVGIGDDAAVLEPAPGPVVVSVDAAVEGVHFEWSMASADVLGRRAATAALSDLAAMGARPSAMLCAMTLPPSLDEAILFGIADGFAEAAREYDAPVIGGNLARADVTTLTTTVLGTLPGPALRRDRARVGDRLFVTGPLGGAALGLRRLLATDPARRAALDDPHVDRWRRPRARIEAGVAIATSGSAGIDVSDGLVQDLGHVCQASSVGARVDATRVPLAPGLEDAAAALGLDPLQLALGGGEDFELCYAAQARVHADDAEIGEVVAGDGVGVVNAAGHPVAVRRQGFVHFGEGQT